MTLSYWGYPGELSFTATTLQSKIHKSAENVKSLAEATFPAKAVLTGFAEGIIFHASYHKVAFPIYPDLFRDCDDGGGISIQLFISLWG
jgi:hypothetical protein